MALIDVQTRDSVGHLDQTADLVYAGDAKEKIKVNVVNEVHLLTETDGAVLDSDEIGGFDLDNRGFDGNTYTQEEWMRRQWNWKRHDQLKPLQTASGQLRVDKVRIDLEID